MEQQPKVFMRNFWMAVVKNVELAVMANYEKIYTTIGVVCYFQNTLLSQLFVQISTEPPVGYMVKIKY